MNSPTALQEAPKRNDDRESPHRNGSLEPDELRRMDAYWRASNYLSVGQIYLYDNPLLREPLTLAHVKPLVVGHWGTVVDRVAGLGGKGGISPVVSMLKSTVSRR